MRLKRLLIAVALMLLVGSFLGPGVAEDTLDGKGLAEWVVDYEGVNEEREGASYVNACFYMGYVRAVFDTVIIMSYWASETPEVLSPFLRDVHSRENEFMTGTLKDAFMQVARYLKENPGSLDLYAPTLIIHALFPGR